MSLMRALRVSSIGRDRGIESARCLMVRDGEEGKGGGLHTYTGTLLWGKRLQSFLLIAYDYYRDSSRSQNTPK